MRTVIVERPVKKFGVGSLSRLMHDCLPSKIEDEADMQSLINKLWPALICEQEVDSCGAKDLQKRILLMAADILDMHGQSAGNRCCQDWSGDNGSGPDNKFSKEELTELSRSYEMENSNGDEFDPDHLGFHDEMMCSFIFSNALREMSK